MTTIATFAEHLPKIKTEVGNIFINDPEIVVYQSHVSIMATRINQININAPLPPGYYLCVFDKVVHTWLIFAMGNLPVLYVGASSVNPQSYGFMEEVDGSWVNKYITIELETTDVSGSAKPYYQRTSNTITNLLPDLGDVYIHYQAEEGTLEYDKRVVFKHRVLAPSADVFESYLRDLERRSSIFTTPWVMTPEQGEYLKDEVIKMFTDITQAEYATSRDPEKEYSFKKYYTFIKDKFDPENVDEIWNAVHMALKIWYASPSQFNLTDLSKPQRLNVSHGEGEFMLEINFDIKD